MSLRVFTGKEICQAWNLRLSDGKAVQATQAFDPWVLKLRGMMERYPTKVYRLLGELAAEIEAERNN